MSTTLAYEQRYSEAKEAKEAIKNIYNAEVEFEIMIRLISGAHSYQEFILTHTCSNMFTDKFLRAIYQIVVDYCKKNGTNSLNFYNLINFLDDKNLIYVEYIDKLNQQFITSADAENWLIHLHNNYEERLFLQCKCVSDFRKAESELSKYKLQNTESNLFNSSMHYLDTYENTASRMIKTLYTKIDDLLGGLQGGNLLVLAGSTGMGKTAMALNIVINIAKQNKKILLFSLEMSIDELLNRIIASIVGISAENLRNRNMTQKELDLYTKYVGSKEFEQLQKYISIPAKNNINIAILEEIARKSDADCIVVDYIGLVKGDGRTNNTYEEVSDVSRRLKLLAVETNKPIIALHQLNRDMKNRQDKHPTLSDIRDSGKIEQDADTICFVYRPAYYNLSADKKEMEFIIAKSRHTGGAGQIAKLIFYGEYQRIIDPISSRKDGKQCTIDY